MLNPIPHLPKKRTRKNIKSRSCAVTRACALTLSLALTFTPMVSLALPSSALAQGANGQSYTYDYLFDKFLEPEEGEGGSMVYSISLYNIFAGNVGDATELSTFSTGNASVNNNTLYVKDGAGLNFNMLNSGNNTYEVAGAAGHIALNGYGVSATATNNTAIMDAVYDINNQHAGGYIANLTGAYIGINNYSGESGRIDIPTTVDTITASNNSVILKNGYVGLGFITGNEYDDTGNYLTGAFVQSYNINSDAQFNLYNNSVLIEGGTVANRIGDALSSGTLAGAYVSTITGNATMSGNSVTITGGLVQANIIAGAFFYSSITDTSGADGQKSFTTNKTSATLYNNSVTIDSFLNNGNNTKIIAGAYAKVSDFAIAENNSVYFNGGTLSYDINVTTKGQSALLGAYLEAYSLIEDTGSGAKFSNSQVSLIAKNNQVYITGGKIDSIIAGAYAVVNDYASGYISADILIENNTVSISGGTIQRAENYTSANGTTIGIFGGAIQGNIHDDDTYSITNNTVNIGFDARLEYNINIGGGIRSTINGTSLGILDFAPNADTYDGNTLNLYNFSSNEQSAGIIANFENINFVLGESQTNGDTLITAGQLYLGNGYDDEDEADKNNGTVATKYANFGLHTSLYNTLSVGESVTLIKLKDYSYNNLSSDEPPTTTNTIVTATLDGNFTNLGEDNSGTYTGTHGALLSRTWDIVWNSADNTLTAKLLSTQIGEQAKILGEVSLANMTAITNSTDLLVGSAIPTAYQQISSNLAVSADSLDSQNSQDSGLIDNSAVAAFMVTSGGSSRYNTGSHVDSNSISLNAGIAKGAKGMSGNWLVGGFFEYNYGNYSTYNSFSTGTVEGDGEVYAFGLGGFARYDFDHATYKPYVEASMRIGYIETDYHTADLLDYSASNFNTSLSYDVDNMYFGMHVGVGNIFNINEKLSIDASLKYFWTHQFSENRNLFGHNVDFDAVNSHRVRLSGRANYTLKDDDVIGKFAVYGGLGLEYEFDGKARSVVDGYETPTPDLQGFTGLGEFGLSFTPSASKRLSIDLGMQAFAGMREGVSASLQFVFKF